MRIAKFAVAAAALTLMSAPVLAESSEGPAVESEASNNGHAVIFIILGLLAVILATVGVGGNDNTPVSP